MTDKKSAGSDPLLEMKTEYERFCEEHGGAVRPARHYSEVYIEVDSEVDSRVEYSSPCQDYPFRDFAKIIRKWQADEQTGLLQYPPMAYAVSQYKCRSGQQSDQLEEPQPVEIKELLRDIRGAANKLFVRLDQLQKYALQIHDPDAPFKYEHLAWLDAYLAQAIAGNTDPKIDEHPKAQTIRHRERTEFLKRLAMVVAAAKEAQKRVDVDLLRRKTGPTTSALTAFVWDVAPIWEILTAEKAKAYEARSQTAANCPFVQFVGELAEIAGQAEPSWKQVKKALESYPPS